MNVIERGLARKKQLEEAKKKPSQPGFFSNLRNTLSGGDPAIRGAARTSPELLKREQEARRKKEEEKRRRGY
jgi:hypothetical protein